MIYFAAMLELRVYFVDSSGVSGPVYSAVLFCVLCGPLLGLSVLFCADLTMLIQCSKLLGLQPPA